MNERNNVRREKSRRIQENDRRLLRLDEERRELWSQLRNAPLRKLKEPYQKGWERFFDLSEQAKRRKDSDELEAALHLIRNYQRCSVNPFRQFQWKSRRIVPWEHNLSGLSLRRILSERIPLEYLKHFRLRLREPVTQARLRELLRSGWTGLFWFRYPEYAISHVQPFLITHTRVALPEVERRLAEIEANLQNRGDTFRLNHLKDTGAHRWDRISQVLAERQSSTVVKREIFEARLEFNEGHWNERRRPFIFLN
ncbi:hypothetical protein GCM10007100_08870 [Roseibacillus persicicus]|uniref:Uncharacterized protein n=1 Tax=Roseibacillus persicicus TaxID=454148 RepID=A0A918WGL0_9BACT|nr:hypothetical protein GCM10007100_08870 [Roseibacillus persicicus]